MRIGTEHVSLEQQQMLAWAREDPESLPTALDRVFRDSDIREDREEVHPDWADLIEQHLDLRAGRGITFRFSQKG